MCPESFLQTGWILTFQNVHRAIGAERKLKAGGMGLELIPVPRPISSACGFCILVSGTEATLPGAGALLERLGQEEVEALWAVYEREPGNQKMKEKLYERAEKGN